MIKRNLTESTEIVLLFLCALCVCEGQLRIPVPRLVGLRRASLGHLTRQEVVR